MADTAKTAKETAAKVRAFPSKCAVCNRTGRVGTKYCVETDDGGKRTTCSRCFKGKRDVPPNTSHVYVHTRANEKGKTVHSYGNAPQSSFDILRHFIGH